MDLKTPNYDIQDDIKLHDLLKNNDEEAFSEIVLRHFYKLYTIAFNIVRSHSDAEEVVWEAFKKAHKSLPQFRGDAPIFMWMRKITINQAYNKLKWNCTRGSKVNIGLSCFIDGKNDNYASKDLDITDYKHIPSDETNNNELGILIVKLIKSLPNVLQETINMFFLQKMPYHEIAHKQHCQIGTVKSRISRGRKILQKNFMSLGIYPNF